MSQFKPVIGISCGDLNGIGIELIIKTFSDNRILEQCTHAAEHELRRAAAFDALAAPAPIEQRGERQRDAETEDDPQCQPVRNPSALARAS